MIVKKYFQEVNRFILCSRCQLYPEDLAQVQAIVAADIDWGIVLQKGTSHRILLLLHKSLK